VCVKLIEEELKKANYKVTLRGCIKGASGNTHFFDIVAQKDKRIICFDFAKKDLLEELVRELIRALDLEHRAEICLIIDKKKAKEYEISAKKFKILQYTSESDLLNQLRQIIYCDQYSRGC